MLRLSGRLLQRRAVPFTAVPAPAAAPITTAPTIPADGAGGVQRLNHVELVGVVHDIQQGFLKDEAVTQFKVTTFSMDQKAFGEGADSFLTGTDIASAVTTPGASPSGRNAPRRTTHVNFSAPYLSKQHFQVRVFGSEFAQNVRSIISEGVVAKVVGRLKVNRQAEGTGAAAGKSFPFPYVHLDGGREGEFVKILATGSKRSGPGAAVGRTGVANARGIVGKP